MNLPEWIGEVAKRLGQGGRTAFRLITLQLALATVAVACCSALLIVLAIARLPILFVVLLFLLGVSAWIRLPRAWLGIALLVATLGLTGFIRFAGVWYVLDGPEAAFMLTFREIDHLSTNFLEGSSYAATEGSYEVRWPAIGLFGSWVDEPLDIPFEGELQCNIGRLRHIPREPEDVSIGRGYEVVPFQLTGCGDPANVALRFATSTGAPGSDFAEQVVCLPWGIGIFESLNGCTLIPPVSSQESLTIRVREGPVLLLSDSEYTVYVDTTRDPRYFSARQDPTGLARTTSATLLQSLRAWRTSFLGPQIGVDGSSAVLLGGACDVLVDGKTIATIDEQFYAHVRNTPGSPGSRLVTCPASSLRLLTAGWKEWDSIRLDASANTDDTQWMSLQFSGVEGLLKMAGTVYTLDGSDSVDLWVKGQGKSLWSEQEGSITLRSRAIRIKLNDHTIGSEPTVWASLDESFRSILTSLVPVLFGSFLALVVGFEIARRVQSQREESSSDTER